MVRAKRLLEDFACALIQRFRLGVVPHGLVKPRQLVKSAGRVRMFGAKRFLAEVQEFRLYRDRFGILASLIKLLHLLVESICVGDASRRRLRTNHWSGK